MLCCQSASETPTGFTPLSVSVKRIAILCFCLGSGNLAVDVLNMSPHGSWLWVAGRERCLRLEQFPWFRGATLSRLFKVRCCHGNHFYWPELDVDLDLDRTIPRKSIRWLRSEARGSEIIGARAKEYGTGGGSRLHFNEKLF
jgi:hypothetical protein